MKDVQHTPLTPAKMNELADKFDATKLAEAIKYSKDRRNKQAAIEQYAITVKTTRELQQTTDRIIPECINSYCNVEELIDREPLEGNA